MGFTQSLINQIGRDAGKVISNQIFKNQHSTPVRMTNFENSTKNSKKVVKTEFEKSINFQMGFKPNTLVNKLLGAQIELKNEMKKFTTDKYLSEEESDGLFEMIGTFNSKVSNVYDVLNLDETSNKSEIELIDKIVEQAMSLFCEVLDVSIKGCESKSLEHTDTLNSLTHKERNFFVFVLLYTIWLGKYAKTNIINTKDIILSIIGNLFTIPLLFVHIPVQILLMIFGVFDYFKWIKNYKKTIEYTRLSSELEKARVVFYSTIRDNNLKSLNEIHNK